MKEHKKLLTRNKYNIFGRRNVLACTRPVTDASRIKLKCRLILIIHKNDEDDAAFGKIDALY